MLLFFTQEVNFKEVSLEARESKSLSPGGLGDGLMPSCKGISCGNQKILV